MGKKFTDFINKMEEEAKKDKNGFNPGERIEYYRNLVKSLYADIDSWLDEEIKDGKIKTGTESVTITEEPLGRYSIDQKWIQIGNANIQFQPIGTMLVGTNARVDMVYRSKDVMIIREGKNVDSPYYPHKRAKGKEVWKYVKYDEQLSYVTLDKDRFEDLIIQIVDGDR